MDIVVRELESRGCDKIERVYEYTVVFRHRCQYYSVALNPMSIRIQNLEIGKNNEYVYFICKEDDLEKRFHEELVGFLPPIKAKTLLWVATVLLGLHQRAAVTANHPLRKLERGEFGDEENDVSLFYMSYGTPSC